LNFHLHQLNFEFHQLNFAARQLDFSAPNLPPQFPPQNRAANREKITAAKLNVYAINSLCLYCVGSPNLAAKNFAPFRGFNSEVRRERAHCGRSHLAPLPI
jgi:hypothetical protein